MFKFKLNLGFVMVGVAFHVNSNANNYYIITIYLKKNFCINIIFYTMC